MTGAETLAQVQEALHLGAQRLHSRGNARTLSTALLALDGCVLLTRKEADVVRYVLRGQWASKTARDKVLALLDPERPA